MKGFTQGLAHGAGLSIPLLGAGLLFEHKVKKDAEEAARNVRNQALMAAGLYGGIKALTGNQKLGDAMSMDLQNFVRPETLSTLKRVGLSKFAGAMLGVDELTIKEAAREIGRRAFMSRVEAKKIASGIDALAELQGVPKTAAPSLLATLAARSIPHAIGGAAIAAAPELTADGPVNTDKLIERALMGGGLGLVGGMGANLYRGEQANPSAARGLGETVENMFTRR